MFKFILLGEAGVGKSSLFLRIKDNIFGENIQPTPGIETCSKTVHVNGQNLTIALWDTTGEEKYGTLKRHYYRNSHVVLLVFSCDDPVTLYYLKGWIQDAAEFAPSSLKYLIGNKTDLERLIPKNNVKNFCEAHGCEGVFYVSAKSGEGILEAINEISYVLLEKYPYFLTEESQSTSSVTLSYEQRKRNERC